MTFPIWIPEIGHYSVNLVRGPGSRTFSEVEEILLFHLESRLGIVWPSLHGVTYCTP